jgi:hypothetical protein
MPNLAKKILFYHLKKQRGKYRSSELVTSSGHMSHIENQELTDALLFFKKNIRFIVNINNHDSFNNRKYKFRKRQRIQMN